MPFDTYFFRLPLAKAQYQQLVHDAAVRLQGGPFHAGIHLQPSDGLGSARAADGGRRPIDQSIRDSAKDVASAQLVSGEHIVSEVKKLESIEAASLGVNIANTAVLAVGLYALYRKMGEATGHLEQLERLSLENRILAERQTETAQAILKALHESRRIEASQLIEQGERNAEAGLNDEAVDRFKKALEYDNTDPVAWMNLAILHAGSAQTDSADDAFRKGLMFSRGVSAELNASIKRSYARFLAAAGRLEDGIRILAELGESAEEDDQCERATYLLLAGRKDEARKLLAALLKQEHSYVVRLAVDPRICGSARGLLDKWLAQAHTHFLGWLNRSLQTVAELETKLRKHDAPADLIDQTLALGNRLQALLTAKEIASSAEIGKQVEDLRSAFDQHLAEARETLKRRQEAKEELVALLSDYSIPSTTHQKIQSPGQFKAERDEKLRRIQSLIKDNFFQCQTPDHDPAQKEVRLGGLVALGGMVSGGVIWAIAGDDLIVILLGALVFFGCICFSVFSTERRAATIRSEWKQRNISSLERSLIVPAWTTIQFPKTLLGYGTPRS